MNLLLSHPLLFWAQTSCSLLCSRPACAANCGGWSLRLPGCKQLLRVFRASSLGSEWRDSTGLDSCLRDQKSQLGVILITFQEESGESGEVPSCRPNPSVCSAWS